jgi:hypothetical protein
MGKQKLKWLLLNTDFTICLPMPRVKQRGANFFSQVVLLVLLLFIPKWLVCCQNFSSLSPCRCY